MTMWLPAAVWQVGVLSAVGWISRGIPPPSRDMLLAKVVTRTIRADKGE
jgi:hypothetical protein